MILIAITPAGDLLSKSGTSKAIVNVTTMYRIPKNIRNTAYDHASVGVMQENGIVSFNE